MNSTDSGFTNREMLRTIARLQARGGLSQSRLSWLDESLNVAKEGPIVYFVGCVPFADLLFGRQVETSLLQIPRAAVRLLNFVGVAPVVLSSEVCCGLDAHLHGEKDTVSSLAEQNAEMFRAVGAKTILTTCSAGAWMLRQYIDLGFDHGCEVVHLAEFLAGRMDGVVLPSKTAIWPSCIHGSVRASDRFDISRMAGVAGAEVVDLANVDSEPLNCCAGWLPKDANARDRVDRLIDAAIDANCERILTLCPRCLVSLKFALRPGSWVKGHIDAQDLIVYLGTLLKARGK